METEAGVWVANVLRIFPIALGAMTLGVTFRVFQLYWRAYRAEVHFKERRGQGHHRGLLPLHVTTIGLSHLLLTVYVVITQVSRVGSQLNPTNYTVATVGLVVSLYALLTILRFEHRRVQLTRTRGGHPDAASPPPTYTERRREARQDSRLVAGLLLKAVAAFTLVVVFVSAIVTFGRLTEIAQENRAFLEEVQVPETPSEGQ